MIRLIGLCVTLLLTFPALGQTRHALVVGVDDYAELDVLQKARNDARAVAAALEEAGFRVETLIDPDRRALLAGLAGLSQRLQPGDEAVFFFAGHGVEVAGRNVLLAADVPRLRPGDEVLLDSEGLPVDRVLAAILGRGARAAVLIIDACRDNPFPQLGSRSLGAERGLARLDPPAGAMVVFSAGAGQAALDRLSDDDSDPNSVFTRRLIPLLSQPGLPLHVAARQLRIEVEDLAATVRHDQRPAVYDEMRGDFVLLPTAMPADTTVAAPVAEPLARPDPCTAALPVWAAIQSSNNRQALESFAATYATSCPALAALAQESIAALVPDWTRATSTTLTGHAEFVISAAFSPDGRRIVTASWDNTARVWDAETGRAIVTLTGHTRSLNSAAFSPDGRRIVTTSEDRTARLWDTETGRAIAIFTGHTDWVLSAAFSPDGRRIATGSLDNTARLWDAETGRVIAILIGHTNSVRSAAFSPDARRIVTASNDGTARVWDTETGRTIAILSGHADWVLSAVFSPNGRWIVTGSLDDTARIWDIETRRVIATLAGHINGVLSAAFSHDGRRIVTVSNDSSARVWDTETGLAIAILSGHSDWVRRAAFSYDGQRIVTASEDRTARLWETETGQVIATLNGHTDLVSGAAFSPDGRRIVTASWDNTARLWTTP